MSFAISRKGTKELEVKKMIKLSVVIPAYHAAATIGDTVRSLQKQAGVARETYEVIVVINGPADEETRVKALAAGADKVVREPEKGTNIARNCGAGAADPHSQFICGMDADSQAPQDWLARILEIFQDDRVQAVSGPYDYGFTGLRALAEKIYTQLVFPLVISFLNLFKGTAIIIGGNYAIRKSALEKIGGIPPAKFWGDDALLAMLIQRMVGKVLFVRNLRVKSAHDRFDRDGFLKLAATYAAAFLRVWWYVPAHPTLEDLPKIIHRL